MEAFKSRDDSLRVAASKIAALTGFHPFQSLPQVLCDLVYQGRTGRALLRHDAGLLGLSLVNEEQQLLELAKKASKETLQAAQAALLVKSGQQVVVSNQAAARLKQQVVSEAKKSKQLQKEEIKALAEYARSFVDTGYGTHHEAEALNLYEKQCGWEVRERNSEVLSWPFRRLGQDTVEPMGKAMTYRKNKPEVIVIDESDDGERISSQSGESWLPTPFSEQDNDISQPQPTEKPFFIIVGAVDGVLEELWFREVSEQQQQAEEWLLKKVIVECKHRMKRAHNPPPFYDQIQAVSYSMMYETDRADIIQVLRKERHRHERAKEKRKRTKAMEDEQPPGCYSGEPSLKKIPDVAFPKTTEKPTVTDNCRPESTLSPRRKISDYFSPKTEEKPTGPDERGNEQLVLNFAPHERAKNNNLTTLPVNQRQDMKHSTGGADNGTGDIDKAVTATEAQLGVRRTSLDQACPPDSHVEDVAEANIQFAERNHRDKRRTRSLSMPETERTKDNMLDADGALQAAPETELPPPVRTLEPMNVDVDSKDTAETIEATPEAGDESSPVCFKHSSLRPPRPDKSVDGNRKSATQKDQVGTDSMSELETTSSSLLLAGAAREPSPSSLPSIDIVVSRIELDDPVMQHRHNWGTVVLPRLRSFVDAVYRVRSDDGKRYALLASLASSVDKSSSSMEAWNLLHAECPWLVQCDTSYKRERESMRESEE